VAGGVAVLQRVASALRTASPYRHHL